MHINGSLLVGGSLTITANDSGHTYSLSANVNAGDKVSLYCNGTNINKPRMSCFFRRR